MYIVQVKLQLVVHKASVKSVLIYTMTVNEKFKAV